ncbi:colicin E1 immunity protein [Escherichia coli]|uniref:colicin E1 immunity protein n=1 Tax=Escherichia coli TaxID=562 RepID=UPI00201ED5C1|nr:colicin E1 immunity protein [Escherichia coli]
MVLYPVAKWYIEDTALKFTRPDFWNSGFFADTPGKMGLLAVYTGTVFILSLPLSLSDPVSKTCKFSCISQSPTESVQIRRYIRQLH